MCDTYQEHDEGLGIGNYALDNAPLPHPFCRCNWHVDSSKSLEEIGDEVGRWIAGEENARLDRAFGEWEGRDGVATAQAISYTDSSGRNDSPILARPFEHGKMHDGDIFRYNGKIVTFDGWNGNSEIIAGKGCRRIPILKEEEQ